MQIGAGRARLFPERGIESHGQPPPGAAVEKRTGRNDPAEHFLQAQGLGAKLHRVAGIGLGLTELVFHGKGPFAGLARMEFHHVGHAEKSQFHRAQGHGPGDPHAVTRGVPLFMPTSLLVDV